MRPPRLMRKIAVLGHDHNMGNQMRIDPATIAHLVFKGRSQSWMPQSILLMAPSRSDHPYCADGILVTLGDAHNDSNG
jgi:hypothetical protein